ncbi:MAG: thioredoxin-disulfide reductase [Desulfonatronovibrionaceae bacterium]
MKEYESLIIGGGPAGITAALYLLRSGVKIAWVEKLAPGGQVLLTENIENYPGFPESIKGYELIDKFTAHLDDFEFDRIRDEVKEITPGPDYHTVSLENQQVQARTVIVCSGSTWKRLGIPGEERFMGRGISNCAVCDGNFFRGREVACIGGGDTALEESLYLAKLASKVYLIHRRDRFRGAQYYQEKVISHPKIEILYHTVAREFQGQDSLTGIRLKNLQTSRESVLEVEGAFVFVGLDPAASFIPPDIDTDPQGFIITDTEMATSVPGVFAAGDIRSKLCRQVSSAVGDGATAAHNAHIYLEQNT